MALIGNYSLLNRSPYRQFATGVSSNYKDALVTSGNIKNRNVGGFDETSATPNGYLHPSSWVLPLKPGGMSSYTIASAALTPSAVMYAGRPISFNASSIITATNAQLDQIIEMIASAVMSIAATNAAMSAAVGVEASSSMAITTLTAQLGGFFPASASASATLTGAITSGALAYMEAEAGGPTPLSPEALAAAVWNAVIADFQEAGTTGAALGDAGGAGNPWSADLSSNDTAGTFGKHVQELLKRNFYLGTK
jgi:hypothetical protein